MFYLQTVIVITEIFWSNNQVLWVNFIPKSLWDNFIPKSFCVQTKGEFSTGSIYWQLRARSTSGGMAHASVLWWLKLEARPEFLLLFLPAPSACLRGLLSGQRWGLSASYSLLLQLLKRSLLCSYFHSVWQYRWRGIESDCLWDRDHQ